MRILLLLVVSSTLTCLFSIAQGVEGVIVEKYYVSESRDTLLSLPGALPEGSVTYRVFIDMKPGYSLQSVYGSPGHEMKLATTTFFYNHPNYGNFIANMVMDYCLKYNTVMLDSWISVGAGSQDSYGVLKVHDDTTGTIVNTFRPPMLQNHNSLAGIPICVKDGMQFNHGKPPRVSALGLDILFDALDKLIVVDSSGYVFRTENGAWGCLAGSQGLNIETNIVLIGQFTTSGDFSFEFNLQLGLPEGGVEQHVAKNAVSNEIHDARLIIDSRLLP